MGSLDGWQTAITGFFNWLSSLSWPGLVLIIVLLFKDHISSLLDNLKWLEIFGIKLGVGDTVRFHTTFDKETDVIGVRPPSAVEEKVPRLSNDEIEQSKQRALKRIDEDTKKVGYQRGKLRLLENGGYAVAWDVQVSDRFKIKG